MLKTITLDYWDTLYVGAAPPGWSSIRRAALRRLVEGVGLSFPDDELDVLYRSGVTEAERWWRDEHRGYTTSDRIRWMLSQVGVERPADCSHVAEMCEVVDDVLLSHPPRLLAGVPEMLESLSRHYRLVIISDTGFASGQAQDRVLERDGLLGYFTATIYSCDVGHSKPHPAPFREALRAAGVDQPGEALHVGDIERTDVCGALAAGMRAVRLDALRDSGPSKAEFVAHTVEEVVEWIDGMDRRPTAAWRAPARTTQSPPEREAARLPRSR